MTDSAIKTYEKKQISGILTGDVQESYETVMSEEDRESAGSMQIELNLDSARRTEFPSAILEFTMTSDERNVLEIQINDGYSHEYVHNWDTPRKVHMELPQDAEKVTLTVKDPKGNIRIDQIQVYGLETEPEFSDLAKITVDAPKKDSYLTGHISASQDGYVMLAVPNEAGWSVKLNGEKQELSNGDYGFISFPVKAGEYDMEVIFTAPLLHVGILVSVFSTLVFVVIVVIRYKKKKGKV